MAYSSSISWATCMSTSIDQFEHGLGQDRSKCELEAIGAPEFDFPK